MKDLEIEDAVNEVTLTATKTTAIKLTMRDHDYDAGSYARLTLTPDTAKHLGTWLLEASKEDI